VRIHDLAADLIRLSGKDPERNPIIVTGRRPGEKMHEELFTAQEHPEPTGNTKILAVGHNSAVRPELMEDVDVLVAAAEARDWDIIDLRMRGLFPDYVAPDSWLSIKAHRRPSQPRSPVRTQE
jgi:O-antigen biosynthesis protein WbqV